MRIDSTGNLGIGTTGPTKNLHVYSATENATGYFETDDNSDFANFKFDAGSDVHSQWAIGTGGSSTASQYAENFFFATNQGSDVVMLIEGDTGNVGIGTTSPDSNAILHLSDSDARLYVEGSANTDSSVHLLGDRDWQVQNDGNASLGTADYFHIRDNTAGASRLTIDTSGDIGIGVAEPNELLEVGGDGRAFFGDGAGSTRQGLLIDGLEGSTSARIEAYDYDGSTGMDLVFNTFGGGDVGIGEGDPDARLHVTISSDGSPVRFEDSDGYCEVNPTSTTWSCTSDESLKTNILSIEKQGSFESILDLRPVTFEWKTNRGKTRTGLIAQEVEEVFPDLVITNEDGLKSVAYGGLIPHLVLSVQELDRKLALLGVNPESTLDSVMNFASVIVGTLEIGSPDEPTGITVYDSNGDVGCLRVNDVNTGEVNVTPGECGSTEPEEDNNGGGTVVNVGDTYDEDGNVIDPSTGESVDEDTEEPSGEEAPTEEEETTPEEETETPVEEPVDEEAPIDEEDPVEEVSDEPESEEVPEPQEEASEEPEEPAE